MVKPWEYLQNLQANFYHPAYQALVPRHLEALLKNGILLNPYTVNDPSVAEGLIKNRINAIITDVPDVMVALRQKFNPDKGEV